MPINDKFQQKDLEYLRQQATQKFDKIRGTWIDIGEWVMPYRLRWLLSQTRGKRNNHHIVDITHILALRSFVAGFLEGNTSASRPWFAIVHPDPDVNGFTPNRMWLDFFTNRVLAGFAGSNYYNSAGQFYYDYGTFNTGAQYIEEKKTGGTHFHNLEPGAYKVLNNSRGEATTLVREFCLTVKNIVDRYAKKTNGHWDWSNISKRVRTMYENGDYYQEVDIVNVVMENPFFDLEQPITGSNRQWVSLHYEVGGLMGNYSPDARNYGTIDTNEEQKYLEINYSKRKPFVVGKAHSSGNFEYGEDGPSTIAINVIKSLNKKEIAKDVAIEKMINPAMQGSAHLNKSYVTTQSNKFIPLDPTSLVQGGLKPVHDINQGLGALVNDQADLRQTVNKAYYADFLLYLSLNPKTRTAEETRAIINEQQLVLGPNLQALNWSYNTPLVEFMMDYTLDNDPYLPPAPEGLQGQFLSIQFISTFAQAQKAADLPNIRQYVNEMMNLSQFSPGVLDKVNLDRLADLYEDRLFLPAGLNRDQSEVDQMRQQAQAQAQRNQMIQEQLPALADAAKNFSTAQKP